MLINRYNNNFLNIILTATARESTDEITCITDGWGIFTVVEFECYNSSRIALENILPEKKRKIINFYNTA